MFRQFIFSATRLATISTKITPNFLLPNISKEITNQVTARNFTSLLNNPAPTIGFQLCENNALRLPIVNTSIRPVTKVSIRKGKRKSVKAVLKRFYRLNWGCWIRTKAGRHKKLWKKSPPRKRRLRQHVFCNATQSYMLDKMVGPYWRKPRYYVADPYQPYHSREEWQFSRIKPRPYFPPEEEKL